MDIQNHIGKTFVFPLKLNDYNQFYTIKKNKNKKCLITFQILKLQ